MAQSASKNVVNGDWSCQMPQSYKVVAGDTLTKIAHKFKKPSWRTIYNAPENADFRRKRPNPDLIYPGDVLIISDLPNSPPPPKENIFTPVNGGAARPSMSQRTDGIWEFIEMNSLLVIMKIWIRGQPYDPISVIKQHATFELWIVYLNSQIFQPAFITQGGYQSEVAFKGRVIINHRQQKVGPFDEDNQPSRGYISYFSNPMLSSSTRTNFSLGVGNPPNTSTAGLGGLVCAVKEGKPAAEDSRWLELRALGTDAGVTFVAQRTSDNLLMLGSQRHISQRSGKSGPAYTVDQIRDQLIAQNYDDAIFLDGGDSLLLDYAKKRVINPGWRKQTGNATHLTFETKNFCSA